MPAAPEIPLFSTLDDESFLARLFVTDRTGKTHQVEAPAGERLMFVLRDDAGLPVEGLCGGSMVCGTCHVLVAETWSGKLPPPSRDEADMLDSLGYFEARRSRLSCQIEMSEALDGLALTLAPEE